MTKCQENLGSFVAPEVSRVKNLSNRLIHAAEIGGLLHMEEWKAFADDLPEHTAEVTGLFVGHLQEAYNLHAAGLNPFILARMIAHDLTRSDAKLFPKALHTRPYTGAREVLLALMGGELYKQSIQGEIAFSSGAFTPKHRRTSHKNLRELFHNSSPIGGDLYSGAIPPMYKQLRREFLERERGFYASNSMAVAMLKAFRLGDKNAITDRPTQYDISWKVLLEKYLERLLESPPDSRFILPPARRIIDA